MVTFFLWWGLASLAGTFLALSLVWSGKRNDCKLDSDMPPSIHDVQPQFFRLRA